MFRKTGPLLAAFALGVSVAAARADTTKATNLGQYIAKGRTEYLVNGAFRFNSPSSQDISFRFGPMVTERVQVGLDFSYHNDGGNSGTVGLVGNYFVGNLAHKTIPYAGVGVGTTFGDPGTHSEYGVQGGVKHFLNEDVAATFELQYRRMEGMDWSGGLIGLSFWSDSHPMGHDFELPKKGWREIDLSGIFNFDDPEEEFISFFYGMFIDDKSEAGLAFSYDHVHFSGTKTSGDINTGFVGGEYNYHLNSSAHGRSLPYVGAHLGTTFGDGPNTASYGAQVGVKYFLTRNVAIKPEFRWTHFNQSGSSDDTRLTFGFAYFLPH